MSPLPSPATIDTGHFALEPHVDEIADAIRDVSSRKQVR
jgi:hypothetical protein